MIMIPFKGLTRSDFWTVSPVRGKISTFSKINNSFSVYSTSGELLDSYKTSSNYYDKFSFSYIDKKVNVLPKESNEIHIHENGVVKVYSCETNDVLAPLYFPLEIDSTGHLFLYSIPNLNIGIPQQRKEYFNSNILKYCSIVDSSIVIEQHFGHFPEVYRSEYWNEFYPIATKVDSRKMAYVFSAEPILYIYNCENRETTTIELSITPNNLSPVNIDSTMSYTYIMRYELGAEKYVKLLYDSSRDHFLIFKVSRVESESNHFERSTWHDKELTVFAIDSGGELLAVKNLGNVGRYHLGSFFTSDGVAYLGTFATDTLAYEKWTY